MFRGFVIGLMYSGLLAGALQAGVALNQNFDGLQVGPLPVMPAGKGSLSSIGGLWSSTFATSTNPSIAIQDPYQTFNLSVCLENNNIWALGQSNVAPIPSGTPFILSFSQFYKNLNNAAKEIGSSYLYADNSNVSATSTGIAIYNTTLYHLFIFNKEVGGWVDVGTTLADCNDKWVDYKIHVTTWNDGTGYGRYDLWLKKQGQPWLKVFTGNSFNTLGNGVNSVLLRPRGGTGVINNFDSISISTSPLDCQSVIIAGAGLGAADIDQNCKLDWDDFTLLATNWRKSTIYPQVQWDYKWDCDDLPEDHNATPGRKMYHYIKSGEVLPERSISNGIYTCSSSEPVGGGLSVSGYARTAKDLIDANRPLMVEARFKVDVVSGIRSSMNYFISQEDGSNDRAKKFVFEPDSEYANAQGWQTVRFVSYTTGEKLNRVECYSLDENGTWMLIGADAVEPSSNAYWDFVASGDLGTTCQGVFHQDYDYYTQQAEDINAFLEVVKVRRADINNDGVVDFEDLAVQVSVWLQDVNP
ncbi:MAG: hypothetical protein A2Y12_11820 [Planctomycetes bacterium GWF2_42_9]|nr:MAG: hypothetical protein A2Y12_11820 [Planctomycetes bacterium GWF2_42_9]